MNARDLVNVLVIAGAAGVAFFVYRKSGTIAKGIATGAQAVNPLNNNNVFAQAANATTQFITGDPLTTLGGKLYDLTVAIGINPDAGKIATEPSPIGKSGRPKTVDLGTYSDDPSNPSWFPTVF